MNENQTTYHIYGRTQYEKPLAFIKEMMAAGSVSEETLADVGREEWIELIAIPTDSWIQVIGDDPRGISGGISGSFSGDISGNLHGDVRGNVSEGKADD